MERFTDWLQKKIDKNPDLTIAGVAEEAGLDNSTLRLLIKRGGTPKLDNAIALAQAAKADIIDFLGGERLNTFPTIPRLDVALSAGHGAFNADTAQVLDHIPFTQEFLSKRLGRTSTKNLICCDVMGESMEPTLREGDMVIVDTATKETPAGVYAVNYQGTSMVKRLEQIGEGYTLLSDHPSYLPMHIKGDDLNNLEIVGRVVWAAKTKV